jgi:hypothetical protein
MFDPPDRPQIAFGTSPESDRGDLFAFFLDSKFLNDIHMM